MIGIFDSGAGGELTLRILRSLMPKADICLLSDRENAPYGTKDESALIRLVREDIRRLKNAGANEILIGCCTASTIYNRLTDEEQLITYPIINPTAVTAARLSRGRIGIIATAATVRSHAFLNAIKEVNPNVCVFEFAVQELVSMIESGVTDERHTKEDEMRIHELLSPISSMNIDTLILGCTHFPLVNGIISDFFGNVLIISSAYEGAKEMARTADGSGTGRTIYL